MRSWLTGNILTGLVLGLSVSTLWLGLDAAMRPAFAEGRDPTPAAPTPSTPAATSVAAASLAEAPRTEASNEDSAARLKAWIAQNRPIWEARRNAKSNPTQSDADGESDAAMDSTGDNGLLYPTTQSNTLQLTPAAVVPAARPAEDTSALRPWVASSDAASSDAAPQSVDAAPTSAPAGTQLAASTQETGNTQATGSNQATGSAPAPTAPQNKATTGSTPQTNAAPGSNQSDQESPDTVHLIADEVGYDQDLGVYVARGHVQVRRGDKTALADTVAYNERTKRITATGHVSILEPTGDTMFGDYIDISDDFSNGAFDGFRALMADKSRLAANKATKLDKTHTDFDHAVYTPCQPCKDDPTRVPLWQIKARDALRDQDNQTITYHDAWMEMWGVPVFYTPWFRHPDIGVKRQSGLLSPGFSYSARGGFQYRQPYFLTLGDDKDLTLTPIFRYGGSPEKDPGAVGMVQYRQRIEDGLFSLGGSMTVEDRPSDSSKGGTDTNAFRGHIEGEGLFNLNDDWRAGFNFKNTTDKDYLRHYHLGATRWLQDQLYTEGFFGRSYASAWAYAFQSTRRDLYNSDAPFVAPKLDYNFISEPGWAGSTIGLNFDTMNIVRRNDEGQFRVAATPSFTLPYTSPLGDIYKLTVSLETALYAANNVNPSSDTPSSNDTSFSGVTGRVVPKADFTWRFPFVRPSESFTQVIEPIVQLVAAPTFGNSSKIANEDSRYFDLDDTRLFSADRFVGLDRADTGSRATYGINWSGYLNNGGQANLFLGQSYQFTKGNRDQNLTGTGIDTSLTDVVGRAGFSPNPYLDLSYRFRLNVHDGSLKRQEALASAGIPEFTVGLSYLELDSSQGLQIESANNTTSTTNTSKNRREYVGVGVNSHFADFWTLGVSSVYDVQQSRISQVGGLLNYLDECFGLNLAAYYNPRGGSDNSDSSFTTYFSITFKNIGTLKSGY